MIDLASAVVGNTNFDYDEEYDTWFSTNSAVAYGFDINVDIPSKYVIGSAPGSNNNDQALCVACIFMVVWIIQKMHYHVQWVQNIYLDVLMERVVFVNVVELQDIINGKLHLVFQY